MPRVQFLIRFGYDGGRFHGSQPQPSLPTAGGMLHARLHAAFGQPPRALQFTSRTDGGVHAIANLATTWLPHTVDVEAGLAALRVERDDGLVDVWGEQVPRSVNARAISRGKHYRYVVRTGLSVATLEALEARVSWHARRAERRGEVPPLVDADATCWHIHPEPELDAMRAAAAHLLGTHDFAAIRSRRCGARETIRTIERIDLSRRGDAIVFDIHGTAFLRQMIRILVGTLVEVGVGLRSAESMPALLASHDRRLAGMTAPSRGLTLVSIHTVPIAGVEPREKPPVSSGTVS